MGREEVDIAEIDVLVRELTAKPLPPEPTSNASPAYFEGRPISKWSNGELQMPPGRARTIRERFDLVAAAVGLPPLPDVRRYVRMPGPEATVRFWVGLAAVYSASMTFWPYPKTYFTGIVIYLFCLGLLLVSGIWGARLSWDRRLGAAHTISLGTVAWTVLLATTDTLPGA